LTVQIPKLRAIPPVVGCSFIANVDPYGSYAMTWVAKYSLLPGPSKPKDGIPFHEVWSDNHPRKIFDTCSIGHDRSCWNEMGDHSFYVALPLERLNQDWWAQNPDCAYRAAVKQRPRGGILPIAVSHNAYARWMEAAEPALASFIAPADLETLEFVPEQP